MWNCTNPGTESSQVRRQENAQSSYSWKRCEETCAGNNSKHEVHEPSAHDEDLPFLTKEFRNYSRSPNILSRSIEDTCVDMRMFMSSSVKAAIHLGPN